MTDVVFMWCRQEWVVGKHICLQLCTSNELASITLPPSPPPQSLSTAERARRTAEAERDDLQDEAAAFTSKM